MSTIIMRSEKFLPVTDKLNSPSSEDHAKYGVKFIPSCIIFENAYEGKIFSEIVEIQNCLAKQILIRFGLATSSSLKITSSKKLYTLYSGFKCKCKISYTYNSHTAIPVIHFPIFINDVPVEYEVRISSNFSQLVCIPNELNFGTLNVKETFYFNVGLKNIGTKNTSFALDLGQNHIGVVVLPKKGVVPAKEQVNIQFILLGQKEAEYDTELWIKCNVPQKFRIHGKFVIPRLITTNLLTCNYFTLLQFSHLYYGQEETKILVVQNSGSTICMFCSEILINDEIQYFTICDKSNSYFNWVSINPSDGRLDPLQKITIQFRVKPVKHNSQKKSDNFVEFIRLRRINWKDFECEFGDESESSDNALSPYLTRIISKTSVLSTMVASDFIQEQIEFKDDIFDYTDMVLDDFLNVCIYCKVSIAQISVIPYEDYSKISCTSNTITEFKMLVQNDCKDLPIQVVFKRKCNVNIQPLKLNLLPNECKDISIFIKATTTGYTQNKIIGELYNRGYLVGTKSFVISFETVEVLDDQKFKKVAEKVKTAKNTKAYSNQKKLKAVGDYLANFTNNKTKIEPFNVFANLSSCANKKGAPTKLKLNVSSYYNNYMKKLSKSNRLPKLNHKPYDIATNGSSLCKQGRVSLPALSELAKYKKQFIILTPIELASIEISPQLVILRKVAPNTDVLSIVTITNKNSFNIYVRLQSSKFEISFESLCNTTIEQNITKEFQMWYNSSTIGKNIAPFQVVVNNAHVLELNLIAIVVPKEVKVNVEQIDVDPCDRRTEFLQLTNPLNSPVSFCWEINSRCFTIYPENGSIGPERNCLCHVQHTQIPKTSDSAVIILKSEGGHEKHLKLTYLSKSIYVAADVKQLEFKEIALNMPRYKTFTIRNYSYVAASFYLNNAYLIHGLSITPIIGVIPRKGTQKFTVTALISAPVSFSRIISIHVERFRDIDIEVKCSANFPKYDISPTFLKIKNVVPEAIISSTFQIKNLDTNDMKITFDFKEYPEFLVSPDGNKYNSSNNYILRKNENKTFFLHCLPKETTVFALYMPCIINSLIGPILLNKSKSRQPEHFFGNDLKKYENISSVVINSVPKLLNYCKITTVISPPLLKFSGFTIKLKYHHLSEYKTNNTAVFEVSNITDRTTDFCIRTDTLTSPFSFEYSEGKTVMKNINSLFCSLDPEEYTIFSVKFQPEMMKFGFYQKELPLYVKDMFECAPFNTILLQGSYNKPTIKAANATNTVYFQPSGIFFTHEYPLHLELNHHSNRCTINSFCSRPELQVVFKEGRRIYAGNNIMEILLKVMPRRTLIIDEKLTFGCSCGPAKLEIIVKGFWENCSPTSYSLYFSKQIWSILDEDGTISSRSQPSINIKLTSDSVMSNTGFGGSFISNLDDFPLFPKDEDNSPYAHFMRDILCVVESWMNCQGFYNNIYYTVPDSLNIYRGSLPPLATLLIDFGGIEVRRYLGLYTKASEEKNLYLIYHSCLELLYSQSAAVGHIQAEFLLEYDMYTDYMKQSTKPLMDEKTFIRRKKQCWLDIILQIYKVFVLSRIENPPPEAKNASIVTNKLYLTNSKSLKKLVMAKIPESLTDFYSLGECILLKWAEMHFQLNYKKLWNAGSFNPRRRFDVFDRDFTDSLCFGTILYSFCPFLEDDLKDMYYNAGSVEEKLYHNANVFCNLFYKLKLSFEIKPQQIVCPNIVQMVMLLNYMYEILPHFYPNETVTLHASLSETVDHNVLIENQDNKNVTYHVMFFGTHSEYFQAAQQNLSILPRNSAKLSITFEAKKLETSTATLVLCGEVPGQKYSTSLTMNIICHVTATHVTGDHHISKKVYDIYREEIKLKNITPGLYDIYYVTDDGIRSFQTEGRSYIPPISNVPKQIYINKKGEGAETVDGLIVSVKQTSVLLFGRNKEKGDFAQKLTFSGVYSDKIVEQLHESLPEKFELIKCTCSSRNSPSNFCNRTRFIKIPFRNNILWKSIVNYLVHKTENETASILHEILSFPIGSRILKEYCDFTQNTQFKDIIFAENVMYDVIFPKSFGQAPDTVFLKNIYDNGHVDLPIHLNSDSNFQKPIKFKLNSKGSNSNDTRFYSINFKSL